MLLRRGSDNMLFIWDCLYEIFFIYFYFVGELFFMIILFCLGAVDHLMYCWWLWTHIWELWENIAHQGLYNADYRRIIPRACCILFNQGLHESDQLVSNTSTNVPKGVSANFSQVAWLIYCICSNTRGVNPGTAGDICYDTDSLFSQQVIYNNYSI